MRCTLIPEHVYPAECNRCSLFCPWYYLSCTDRRATSDEIFLADLLDQSRNRPRL